MEHQDWRQYIIHCKAPEKKDKEKSVVVKDVLCVLIYHDIVKGVIKL